MGAQVAAVIDTPPLDQVHWGIFVVDPKSGDTLISVNAQRKFVPASNQKILVTAGALTLLGPQYRWDSAFYATGPVLDGVLWGDLVLHGTGDPTLGPPFHPDANAALDHLVDSLQAAGVRSVQGSLVVDVSRFDSTSVPGSWMERNLPWAYSATGGGFVVGRGEVQVAFLPGAEVGDPVEVRWSPVGDPGFLESRLITLPADGSDTLDPMYLPESRRILLQGGWPAGEPDSLSLAMRDPVRQSTAALVRVMEERGIRLDRGARIAWTPGEAASGGCPAGSMPVCPGARRLAGLHSPPLEEVAPVILKPSQNWMTDQTLMTLGMEFGSEGSRSAGFRVLESFVLGMVDADSLDFSFQDGSGLAADNLVTPRGIVEVLGFMDRSPHGSLFKESMAQPGQEPGTLRNRLEGLEGRVYAKTGTISNVNSLSGYLIRPDGETLIFSILSNGSGLPSSLVRGGIDEIVRILASR